MWRRCPQPGPAGPFRTRATAGMRRDGDAHCHDVPGGQRGGTDSALSPAGPAARGDVPERLLRWAAGLLSAQRAEWGQAMLGELDHIDGRGPRWRFSAGCAGAALLLPPWGRAAGAVWAMAATAAGAA